MESIKELRKICQNPVDRHNPESFIEEKIWRIPSIYLTKLLLYTPLKPDHITMVMIFWGFLVGFFFSFGNYWYSVMGVLVLESLYVLDSVDGEMARYKKMSSLNGVFLDLVAHSINTAVPFIGLTLGLYKSNPSYYTLLAGLSASVFSVLCLNIQPMKHHVMFKELLRHAGIRRKMDKKVIPKNINPKEKKSIKYLGKKLNYLYDQIYMIQIILIGAIANKLYWILIFYGLTFPLIWLAKLVYEYRIGYKPYELLLARNK